MLNPLLSGSDLERGDGVYSAYILPKHINADGRLSIKLRVSSVEGETKVVAIADTGPNRAKRETQSEDGGMNMNETSTGYSLAKP